MGMNSWLKLVYTICVILLPIMVISDSEAEGYEEDGTLYYIIDEEIEQKTESIQTMDVDINLQDSYKIDAIVNMVNELDDAKQELVNILSAMQTMELYTVMDKLNADQLNIEQAIYLADELEADYILIKNEKEINCWDMQFSDYTMIRLYAKDDGNGLEDQEDLLVSAYFIVDCSTISDKGRCIVPFCYEFLSDTKFN